MCALELRLLRWFIWLLRFIWSLLWPSVELLSLCGLKPFTWVQTLLWKFFELMVHALSIRLLQPCQLSQERDVQNNSSELKHPHRDILFPPSNQYVMICHSFVWTANFRTKRKVRDSNGLIDQNSNWIQCEKVCVTKKSNQATITSILILGWNRH